MAKLLYLVHRLPYPPNKGDKVRSFNLLKKLAENHSVFLGTFVDDPSDTGHVPTLRRLCAGLHAEPLHPLSARLSSLTGLASGEALTEVYYRSRHLARWVAETVAREKIEAMVVFSSSMAQYAAAHPQLPLLVDFVDVDSAKWTDYAPKHRWPMSWLYAREGRMLLACERRVAAKARRAFFATEKEAELFRQLAPECRSHVDGVDNGVDTLYFSPDVCRPSPYPAGEIPLVFTGAMDYWPNVDAVTWFAEHVLSSLRQRHPNLRFHVVGRSPTAAVRALAGDAVVVSGTVPDVRPFLQHAAVVVAPLRLARGVQNKILEAMAMGRPVVAAKVCVDALHAQRGVELLPAASVDDYIAWIEKLLADEGLARRVGDAGRARVMADYSWSANLQVIERQVQAVITCATISGSPSGSLIPSQVAS